jgi:hypothetical protein
LPEGNRGQVGAAVKSIVINQLYGFGDYYGGKRFAAGEGAALDFFKAVRQIDGRQIDAARKRGTLNGGHGRRNDDAFQTGATFEGFPWELFSDLPAM